MQELNKFILESIKNGNIEKERAFKILKEINNPNNESIDIAVIGMAGKFPGAETKEEFWKNLTSETCSIGTIPPERRQDMLELSDGITADMEYVKSGYLANIDKFDAGFFGVTAKEALLMDPAQRLLLEVSYQALEDGNYGDNALWGSNTGVYIGIDNTHKSAYAERFKEKEFLALTGSFSGVLASRISYTLNLSGPCMVVDTACSSSLVALHSACNAIKNKECKNAIVGGINLMLSNSNMAVSDLEAEDGRIRVFDNSANGMVWAEGVGAVLVKPLKDAINDKDQIYGIIKGSAINNNGQANGITALKPQAQEQVILNAWKNAKIDPSTISYIEAHSSGTVFGDSIEVKAITNAFKKHTKKINFCGLGTSKTHVGHMVGASGIGGIIKIFLAMKHETLPGFLNFQLPNQHMNLNNSAVYIHNELTNWEPVNSKRVAGINSFGFNGTNCHIVIEEHSATYEREKESNPSEIFLLSAQSEDCLKKYVDEYIRFFHDEKFFNEYSIRDICSTAALCRGHYEYRLAFIINNHEELSQKFKLIHDRGFFTDEKEGVFFGGHQIISALKENKQVNDITEAEKADLTRDAANLLTKGYSDILENVDDAKSLCLLYSKGAHINWNSFYGSVNTKKVRLPLYPLRRTRFWIEKKHNSIKEAIQDIQLTDNFSDATVISEYVAPKSEDEIKLARIWQSTLDLEKIGINDNFFDIGGDSMQALQIVEMAQNEGIQIGITTVLTYRTIKEILNHVGEETDLGHVLIPQENLEKWNILPYTNPNKLASYLHHALPGGIVLSHKEILPWYFEHYVNLCTQLGDDGQLMLDYAEISHTMHNSIIDKIKIPYTEMMTEKDIIGFIQGKIDDGKYVVPFMDEYYLPNKIHYNKKHFVHESLIYGYNQDERVFIGYGFNESNMLSSLFFNFDEVAQAFEMGKIHYKEDASYAEQKAVSLLSVKQIQEPLTFHPDIFIEELENYLESSNVKGQGYNGLIDRVTILVKVFEFENDENRDSFNDNYLPTERIGFGLSAYHGIYHGLEKMQEGERIYDYRLFHVLAEHKKGLLERLLFIAEEYNLGDDFYGLIEQYKPIVDMTENARRLALELMYLGDDAPVDELVNVVTKIIENLMPLQEMEGQILNGVLGYLKQVFINC